MMEVSMSEQTPAAAAAPGLEELPVALDFELGSVTLALGQLAALKPGYVFNLPGRLDSARVLIRANGVKIGHGELVAVGDGLAVQLLAIDAEAGR
jgi:type III secretion protein Q